MNDKYQLNGETVEISNKWAGALLTGTPLTEAQTIAVIAKCDSLLEAKMMEIGFGNNHSFIKKVRDFTLLSKLSDNLVHDYNQQCLPNVVDMPFQVCLLSNCFLDGIQNSWLLSDGMLFQYNNLSKWNTTEDVIIYWQKIAEIFPFLDLNITIFNCPLDYPAITMIQDTPTIEIDSEIKDEMLFNVEVRNGVATLLPPDLSVHNGKIPSQEHYNDICKKNTKIHECYVSDDMVDKILQYTRNQVIDFLQEANDGTADNVLVKVSLFENNNLELDFITKLQDNVFENLKHKTCVRYNKLYRKIMHEDFKQNCSDELKQFIHDSHNRNIQLKSYTGKLVIQLDNQIVLQIEPLDVNQLEQNNI